MIFQVRKWFGEIMKSKSESETYTLSTKFGADSKPSEVRELVTCSNASPPNTPIPSPHLSMSSLAQQEWQRALPDDLACISHSHYIVPQ